MEEGENDGEIRFMMEQLGMDPSKPSDLQYKWIAEAALVQPLPKDWQEHEDANGYVYFHNPITNETTWEPPQTRHFLDLYNRLKLEDVNYQKNIEETKLKEMELNQIKTEQQNAIGDLKNTVKQRMDDKNEEIAQLMSQLQDAKNQISDLDTALKEVSVENVKVKEIAKKHEEKIKTLEIERLTPSPSFVMQQQQPNTPIITSLSSFKPIANPPTAMQQQEQRQPQQKQQQSTPMSINPSITSLSIVYNDAIAIDNNNNNNNQRILIGQIAKLQNLKAKEELNGQKCHVLEYNQEKNRYLIQLLSNRNKLHLKI